MPYYPDMNDPFYGGEKTPSLSWKDVPVGTVFVCEIQEPAKLLQSRDFTTNEPAYWDDAKQNPVMSAVLNVQVMAGPHSVGEARSIWAQVPSNLFVALKEAQKTAGAPFAPGGLLRLEFTGEKPHEKKGFNPIKQYSAKYKPPVEQPGADPFDDPAPAPRPVATASRPTTQAGSLGMTVTRAKW
jgi:hypothetical protein